MGKSNFDTSIKRKLVKYCFVCGNLFFVLSSLMFTIFLFSYTIHSDVCDGQNLTASKCGSHLVTNGFKSTQTLVENGALPKSWTKIVNDTAGKEHYHLCEWNANVERCLEAEPSDPDCASDFDDDGVRKFRLGNDGKCDPLKAPEICKMTGFKDANTLSKQEDIAALGYTAQQSGILLLITFCLGVITTLNLYWDGLTDMTCGLCCPTYTSSNIKPICLEFGRPWGCLPSWIPGCGCWCSMFQKSDSCRIFCKSNKTGEGGYSYKSEAGTIALSFLVHQTLIIYFGENALTARNTINEECLGLKSTPLYGAHTALDFLKDLNGEMNATAYVNTRDILDVIMVVLYWGVLITTACELLAYCLANEDSDDMECFALRGGPDGQACHDLSWDLQNIPPSDMKPSEARYTRVKQMEEYSRRTVQLRGQF